MSETVVRTRVSGGSLAQDPWGIGKEVRGSVQVDKTTATRSYFVDSDGVVVGVLYMFPEGLSLDSYPVLRQTISQLHPTVEFYLNMSGLPNSERTASASLHLTGDETSTTQYLVVDAQESPKLLMALIAIDPYAEMLSLYQPEFLTRISKAEWTSRPQRAAPDAEDGLQALQQFARGEAALLGSCGNHDADKAAQAYAQALEHGLKDESRMAEAHHRLGLALEKQGKLDDAVGEIKKALHVRPNNPEMWNNLGTIYQEQNKHQEAIEAFERAVTLKPNYARARYNLAEVYEPINVRRAIEEYETYLALAEGVYGEQERAARAKERVERLKR